MLLHTMVELELITDVELYLMVESGIRGSISKISQKYANYNHEQPHSHVMYLDDNNQVGENAR